MRADFSVTFTAPKLAHVFPPACERMGEWVVKQIGTPAEALDGDPHLSLNYTLRQEVAWIGKPRAAAANKGNFGHVLILAGSLGKTGAAAMAARAALRAGAGLVTVATPKSALPIVASMGVEFMTEALPETEDGAISLRALDGQLLDKLVARKTVLAVGPGIGGHSETAELVRAIVNKYSLPLVLDADGLNAFAGRMDSFRQDARPAGATVFTPHPGEMARLTGKTVAEIQAQRVAVAREFSQRFGVTLVLKGFRTLIASPDGQVGVNPTGNPGMAKGGTGDVLTGLTAGLLAQFPTHSVGEVATAAVYLHGLAGDLAADEVGQHSMLAGDLLEKIPQAYKELTIVD
jgi:NAD(P)H-hydrate epimerase